jgi:hypothetical protein
MSATNTSARPASFSRATSTIPAEPSHPVAS